MKELSFTAACTERGLTRPAGKEAGLGGPGDSHPDIASMGKIRSARALVAASLLFGLVRADGGAERSADPPRVPIRFAENQGQCAPEIRFQARTPGMVASVLVDGLHLELDGAGLRLRFLGAEPSARVEGRGPSPARAHFLNSARTTRGVRTFERVRLVGLYPGIDLEVHESAGRLEYDLVLAPEADCARLQLELEGADEVRLTANGSLRASVGPETLEQLAPVAWQERADGTRSPLACAWKSLEGGHYGFSLASPEPGAKRVIDPVLVFSTHVGGSNADHAASVFIDDWGATYVTGWARSVDFPLTGPRLGRGLSGKEAVVFKLGPDGRELVYSTTLGGRGDDQGVAIQVTPDGEAIVAGITESDDFPTTDNALLRKASGGVDGFVLGLTSDGSHLAFATLLGGSAEDVVTALARHASGHLTVAGTTRSRDFPVTSSSYCTEPRGGRDAFITRLDSRGERLAFSTRVGGSDDDEGRGLAVDSEGCVYLTGRTSSHDFPTTLGAYDRERCGIDAFVVKLSGGGRTLLYSTFLGGSGQDEGTAVAVDGARQAVVVGWTQSLDFPFDLGRMAPGRKDGFAVRVSLTGNALLHATPLGGGSADEALGVTLDPLGTTWVVGRTRSNDFPVTKDAHQGRLAGAADGFLVRLSVEEGQPLYATYFGLDGEDELNAACADRSGTTLALCGTSSGIPLEQRGDLAGKRRGPSDAYVLCVDLLSSSPRSPSSGLRAGLEFGF